MGREWFEYEFVEFKMFERELNKLCSSENEESELKNYVARKRHTGDGVGKSGMKKIRVPLQGRGTRSGGRVIYYFADEDDAFILFMMIYSKSDQEDLSHDEEVILTKALQSELRALKERDQL